MSFDLSTIAVREPAVLIRDPLGESPSYFWSQDAFDITPVVEYFPIPAAVHAHPEERIKSLHYEITFTLVGEFEALTHLFPNLSASLGASLLGTTDVAWRLITQSGRYWDIPRGGFIERPSITSVPGQTLFGASKYIFVCASDKEPGEAGAFYTYGTGGTFPNYSSLSSAAILTLAPAVTYGALMSAVQGENGITFNFQYDSPMEVRSNGLIRDFTITGQTFTAQFKPYGLTFNQIATACGLDLAMGARLPTETLIAAYTGFYVALRGATCKQARFKLGPKSDFIDGLEFRASQTYASNAQVAPGYVGTDAPV
jgi:hypothetical protein